MDIVIKSLASAVVTAIILVIARFSGPIGAGAIGGIPIVFAISYVILTMNDKSLSRDFLMGGVMGALAAIFFSFVLMWLNTAFTKNHWVNFAVAYTSCFLLALIFAYFTSR